MHICINKYIKHTHTYIYIYIYIYAAGLVALGPLAPQASQEFRIKGKNEDRNYMQYHID